MLRRSFYFSLAALVFQVMAVQPSVYAQKNGPGQKLDAYLTRAAEFGFSGSALVAVDGRVTLHKGYGLADRTRRTPITAESVFDIGSITKQFTAAAIMKLEMQGKLNTADPLSKYISGVPADKASVTLHQLLTHTAGFPEYSGGDYEAAERDDTVKRILQTPLTNSPGTEMNYSNAGYTVLAAVIEEVSGKPYETFLQDELFWPAGMNRTGYILPKFDKRKLPRGYEGDKDLGTALDHTWSPSGPYWNLRGNGGIFSTAGDMYKWYKALIDGVILSADAKKKMFTPFLNNYGYGWVITKTMNGQVIGHGGSSDNGFNARIQWNADKNIVIITMSNAGEYDGGMTYSAVVSRKLNDLALGEEFVWQRPSRSIKPDPAALKMYEGIYRSPNGGEFIVSLSDSRLTIEPSDQQAVDALTRPVAPSISGSLSDRTQKIVAGIIKGEFGPLGESMKNPASAQRYRTIIEQRFKSWETKNGSFKGFQVLGTIPSWWSEDQAPATIIKVNFENGAGLFRFHWKDGQIVGLGGDGIRSPVTIPLQPVSPTAFVGWHLVLAKTVNVQFATGRDPGLTVTTDGKSVKCIKVK